LRVFLTRFRAGDAFSLAGSPPCLAIDDLRPSSGASLLRNDKIYLDIENARLKIENAGLENDVAVRSYSDPVIRERPFVNVEVAAPDAEADVLHLEVKFHDFEADVPDTKAAGLDVGAEVVIRVAGRGI
jgi:hypothetical protein